MVEAWGVLWGSARPKNGASPVKPFTQLAVRDSSGRRRARLFSTLLHVSVVTLLLQGPFPLFQKQAAAQPPPAKVYELKPFNLSRYLPNLRAKGPGGRPGRGTKPDKLPALGSTAFDPRLTLVSNPVRPDNKRQTIIQPSSPPDVRIQVELKLPNIVIPTDPAAVKPPIDMRLDVKVRASRSKSQTPAATPDIATQPSDLALAPTPVVNPLPRLAVPPPPPAGAPAGTDSTGASFGTPAPREWTGVPGGLLILGVDPAPFTGSVALPPGNRYGAFSISPAGGQPGSPGGVPGGDPEGGTGGPGTGGDGSTGIGPGGGGGGGTGSGGVPDFVSIEGGSKGGAGVFGGERHSGGALSAAIPPGMIYPVKHPLHLRKRALTVSTGPIGGGGLRVYNVLRGGKVYTLFLPMPGKSWVLQYCQVEAGMPAPSAQRRGMVAALQHGLVPPTAEEQFDFHRPPVAPVKRGEFILLRGRLGKDGAVLDLHLYRGIGTMADQLALAAFRRWKFQPALRTKEPVAIEILVGIPAYVEVTDQDVLRSNGTQRSTGPNDP